MHDTIETNSETVAVIVAGPPRSGTTLLANLLSGGPAHPLLPECQVITDLIRDRIRSERYNDPTKFRVFLQSSEFADSIYRTSIETILTEILNTHNPRARYVVIKDPYLIEYMNILNRFISWPLRKICIVRDPRDAISSYINVGIRKGCRPNIENAIQFMKPFYNSLMELEQSNKSLFIMRYEDLVTKNAALQGLLSKYVGYDINFDSYCGIPDDLINTADPWFTSLYGKSIDESNIGLFEKVISWDEYHRINDEFKSVLVRFYNR